MVATLRQYLAILLIIVMQYFLFFSHISTTIMTVGGLVDGAFILYSTCQQVGDLIEK